MRDHGEWMWFVFYVTTNQLRETQSAQVQVSLWEETSKSFLEMEAQDWDLKRQTGFGQVEVNI